jgi:replicative DNA helicase
MTGGGLKEGQLAIIAGRTGGGKTVLGMNIVTHVAKSGTPVVAFSLEMSDQDLVMRSILSEGREHGDHGSFEVVRNLPLYVDATSNVTARGITAKIKLLASRHKAKVFVVDYLQLLGTDGGSRETRERIVADMSRSLKICAKETAVAIIALSQVNESGELRESRAIEQDADLVLHVIDVPETTPDPRNRNGPRIETGDYNFFLRVSKQRGGRAHGPIGRAKAGAPGIPLNFDGPNFRFTEA